MKIRRLEAWRMGFLTTPSRSKFCLENIGSKILWMDHLGYFASWLWGLPFVVVWMGFKDSCGKFFLQNESWWILISLKQKDRKWILEYMNFGLGSKDPAPAKPKTKRWQDRHVYARTCPIHQNWTYSSLLFDAAVSLRDLQSFTSGWYHILQNLGAWKGDKELEDIENSFKMSRLFPKDIEHCFSSSISLKRLPAATLQ